MPHRTYLGCKVAQRGEGASVNFFIFVVSAKDIRQWAGIRRVGVHERGTQRIIKDSRVNSIKKFFNVTRRNTIPTGIVVAFNPEIAVFTPLQDQLAACINGTDIFNGITDKLGWGTLSFDFNEDAEEQERPALIVDGQHRLKAISELEEDIPVLVIALIDATSEEQAFQFVVINNKAAKVPTDNVKAILATIDEQQLQERLLNAGVSYGGISAVLKEVNEEPSSPFFHLLSWPLTPGERGNVQLTTIEACLRYIRNQFPALEGDEDTSKDIFFSIWRAVRERFGGLWEQNDRFMSKVNIVSLNEFITDRLAFAYEGSLLDIYETDQVRHQTLSILALIPEEFWTVEWKVKLTDNAVMRGAIKDDLKVVSQNSRAGNPWFEGTKLVGEVAE